MYSCKKNRSEHSLVGWNENVKQRKQNNMPRSRSIFKAMSRARAHLKYALRQCRLDEQMIRSNKLANYMQCHDLNNF